MKLRNKKTGEIRELPDGFFCGDNLKNICEEWEDYEEPKEYWFIRDHTPSVGYAPADNNATAKYRKEIVGNYFETKEEAEKTVGKLKAWKRLRDKGISFEAKVIDRKWYLEPKAEPQQRTFDESHDLFKDIMFVFGGEE